MNENDWSDWVEVLFEETYDNCTLIEHKWEFIDEEEETCGNERNGEENAYNELYADID